MTRNNNTGKLLLAGLAAYAYYKYTQMSPEERENIGETLKSKGKKLFDEYMPDEIKSIFDKKAGQNSQTAFEETTGY